MYLSPGRCLLAWSVTGQSLRTLPYCTPRGLERGRQRLKVGGGVKNRREEEAARTERRPGAPQRMGTGEVMTEMKNR